MAELTIQGSSDDIVEIGGAISDEFNLSSEAEDGMLVAISDGTLLRVTYDGIWRIALVSQGSAQYVKDESPEDDDDRYSDIVTLTGEFRWVVAGHTLAK